CHNYENNYGVLPPAYTYLPLPPQPAGVAKDYENAFFRLLPFIEQGSLYSLGTSAGNPAIGALNRVAWSGSAPPNPAVGTTIVKPFICPTDPTMPGNVDNLYGNGGALYAGCSYRANVMVFDPNAPRSVAQSMPDGTSNTVMFAHHLKNCNSDAQPLEG